MAIQQPQLGIEQNDQQAPSPAAATQGTQSEQHLPADLVQRALALPGSMLKPNQILGLQRAVGMRAVQRLLGLSSPAQISHRSPVPNIQAKLTVTAAGDHYEREADRVAAQVMSMPLAAAAPVQRADAEEDLLQTKPSDIQRMGSGSFAAPAEVEQRILSRRGHGQPLPANTRAFMEPRFGVDFSAVRVHTDNEASSISRQVNALAFTHGRDIYFNASAYDTGSSGGKQLLAHELTHVVQQTGMPPPKTTQEPE